MKTILFATISAAALAFAAPVMAQTVTKALAENESTIEQTGNSNTATVKQNQTQQTATIDQDGNGHQAKILQGEQSGGATINNVATITQKARADGNGKGEANVTQESNNNRATLTQTGDGRADISQGVSNNFRSGGSNTATITQTDTNVASSNPSSNTIRNVAGIVQDGSSNIGSIESVS